MFSDRRRVRLGDVTPRGRARLDAIACYLQDIANDDVIDALGDAAAAWVVRRTDIHVERFPVFREQIELVTWASGSGSRWAERRTSITGERGGRVEASTLWVFVDAATGRPRQLPASFEVPFAEAIGGRVVPVRLRHPGPPAEDSGDRVRWPSRFADFDALGHVNNAVSWAIVEEHLGPRVTAPCAVAVEYRRGVARHQEVTVGVERTGNGLWVFADGTLAATARFQGPLVHSLTH